MATLICAGSLDVSFTGTVCARAWMTLTEKNRASLNFSRPILRSGKILLQKCAILRNAQQTLFVRLTYDSQCCATQRKSAQFVRLELQSAALSLSYAGVYERKYSPMRLPRVFFYTARSHASCSVILDAAGAHGRLVFRETAER